MQYGPSAQEPIQVNDSRVIVLRDQREIGRSGATMIGVRYLVRHAQYADSVGLIDAESLIHLRHVRRACRKVEAGTIIMSGVPGTKPHRRFRQYFVRQRIRKYVGHHLTGHFDVVDDGFVVSTVSDLRKISPRLTSRGAAIEFDIALATAEAGLQLSAQPIKASAEQGRTSPAVIVRRSVRWSEIGHLLHKYRHGHFGEDLANATEMRRHGLGHTSSVSPGVLSRGQLIAGLVLVSVVVTGFVRYPIVTVVLVNTTFLIFFATANIFKLFVIRRSFLGSHVVDVDGHGPQRVTDSDLPVYTILLPVFREAAILDQLVMGISQLDYPSHKLDVKLLLEEDDAETISAASRIELPDYFDWLVVPDVGPRGKARACNFGLRHARGEHLVIYDAEDRPERDQLRKAVMAFRRIEDNVVCLQAKLNYFNRTHNPLTRLFTSEYSTLFDHVLPGLRSFDAVIPLGGTSNHFRTAGLRELGGWNVFNVTEDADLGVRIYLRGWRTEILESTTFEEATSRYHNWIRQRSRWVKGHMQTYLFHMRHPTSMSREMGLRTFVIFNLIFGAGTFCLIINPIYWVLTLLWYSAHPGWIQQMFPRPFLYFGTAALFVGNGAFLIASMCGSYGRRHFSDVKWILLMPLYQILMSLAAWKGFVQLLYKPNYWEKTEHGHCRIEGVSIRTGVPASRVSRSATSPLAVD